MTTDIRKVTIIDGLNRVEAKLISSLKDQYVYRTNMNKKKFECNFDFGIKKNGGYMNE